MLSGLIAGGCSHTYPDADVILAPGIFYKLLAPASLGGELYLTQSAQIRYGEEEYELLLYTELTSERLVIVGTLPTGPRVFSISYDGNEISSEGVGEVMGLIKAEYFLADFQLAQWPMEQLQSSLAMSSDCFANGDCSFTESEAGLGRELQQGNKPVLSIHYSTLPEYSGVTRIQHHQRDYELRIETLDAESR